MYFFAVKCPLFEEFYLPKNGENDIFLMISLVVGYELQFKLNSFDFPF